MEHLLKWYYVAVADMTIQGSLSTLQCALDPAQYRLVRGVLAHNLGESVDDLLPRDAHPFPPVETHEQVLPLSCQNILILLNFIITRSSFKSDYSRYQVWTTSSLKLDLHDVTVKLEPEHGVSSLACINFIKSRLHIETYSDFGQDIDLVSQVCLELSLKLTAGVMDNELLNKG